MFDLAHRHLEASGVVWKADALPQARQRLLLDEVKIFRALGNEEKDLIAQAMDARDYLAGQVVLDVGEVAGHLLVIGTGVISAAVPDGDAWIEAGRMGPGEIMGEEGIIDDAPSSARFTALTSCRLYRIDRDNIRTCLEQRSEIRTALNRLHAFREQASHSLLLQSPPPSARVASCSGCRSADAGPSHGLRPREPGAGSTRLHPLVRLMLQK